MVLCPALLLSTQPAIRSSDNVRLRARSLMLVRLPPRPSGETKSERSPCHANNVLQRRQHAVGPHRAVVVGDVVEHAGVLPAPDLVDRQPPETLVVEQFEIGPALAERAQPGSLAAQIFLADGAQRVGFGRELLLARWRLAAAGSRPLLAWRSALVASSRAAASDNGVSSSGVLSGSATPRSVRHGPRVSLRCRPR